MANTDMPSPSNRGPQQMLIADLKKCGEGSCLRGWRRELDPDGSMDANFLDFCQACARLGFSGDAIDLFGIDDDIAMLSLTEIMPDLGALMDEFRSWSQKTFGGHMELFEAFSGNRSRINKEEWLAACRFHGFDSYSDEMLLEIFDCCDVKNQGWVNEESTIILNTDKATREFELFKVDLREKNRFRGLVTWLYHEEGEKALPATHRLAQRPWFAGKVERLPAIIRERAVERRRAIWRRGFRARFAFLKHIRDVYGNEVRAWRRVLDPCATFIVNERSVMKYCRNIDFHECTAGLWLTFDKDGDGVLRLEEFCPRVVHLAEFLMWARHTCGSCTALWDLPEMSEARYATQSNGNCLSDRKMTKVAFACGLRALKYAVGDCDEISEGFQYISSFLDLHGCGLIEKQDLQWLDCWDAPEWLCAQADPLAWAELRVLLCRKHNHMLRAWRAEMDLDNSNSVSWLEFSGACKNVGFKGNISGAWRVLDTDLSGWISLKEMDERSADLLSSFKAWAETHHGSVHHAFAAMDENGDGSLTCEELVRATRKLKWQGDSRQLFGCLHIPQSNNRNRHDVGKHSISMADFAFLEEWQDNMEDEQLEAEETAMREHKEALLERKLAHRKTIIDRKKIEERRKTLRVRASQAYLPALLDPFEKISPLVDPIGSGRSQTSTLSKSLILPRAILSQSSSTPVLRENSSMQLLYSAPGASHAPRLSTMKARKTRKTMSHLVAIDQETFSQSGFASVPEGNEIWQTPTVVRVGVRFDETIDAVPSLPSCSASTFSLDRSSCNTSSDPIAVSVRKRLSGSERLLASLTSTRPMGNVSSSNFKQSIHASVFSQRVQTASAPSLPQLP